MRNRLFFWIVFTTKVCLAKQKGNYKQDLPNQRLDLRRSNIPVPYSGAKCSHGQRMISYDDVQNREKDLLGTSEFTTAVWVNASATYTPWVIYKGLYTIRAEDIASRTKVDDGTQFTDCVGFCSFYSWTYIGLQENICYCLSPNARIDLNGNQRIYHYYYPNYRIFRVCGNGNILYCVTTGLQLAMALYEKDENKYEGFGECLKSTFKSNMYVSSSATPCNEENIALLCINIKNTFFTGNEPNIQNRLRFCEYNKVNDVDFKTLNTTSKNFRTHNQEFWLNNFRESIFSKGGQRLQLYCVIGEQVNNKIKLQITDCTTTQYVLCINDEAMHQSSTKKATISTARSIPISSEFDVTTTAYIRNIDGPSTSFIIVTAVSVFILIVIITFVIVMRFRKQRRSTPAHGLVYATVRNEMIRDANVINLDRPEVAVIEEDNTYDHTEFITRQPLQQTDANNYDTMENMQVTGESIYHRTVSFKTSTSILQFAESVYDHATNF